MYLDAVLAADGYTVLYNSTPEKTRKWLLSWGTVAEWKEHKSEPEILEAIVVCGVDLRRMTVLEYLDKVDSNSAAR